MTDVLELAQQLVRLDTAGAGEEAAAKLCADVLRGAGVHVEIVEMSTGRAHLLAHVGDTSETPLVLSGHLDTVPAGDQPWTRAPLSGEIADGMLHGRGAADMKGGVAALVTALARHCSHGTTPKRGVLLLLTAGEETGCSGARHLTASRQLPGGGPLLVAEPTGLAMAHGHKGVLWIRAHAHGRSAHGSRPDLGRSAILPLAHFITTLDEAGLPGEHAEMGSVTVNVGTVNGGTRINLVPDSASAEIDIRVVPGVDSGTIRQRLTEFAGQEIALETIDDLAPVYSSPGGSFALLLADAYRRVIGPPVDLPALTYFTDASILTGALRSSEVVFVGPGSPEAAHTTDESCAVAEIEAAARLYEDVLDVWTTGGPSQAGQR